MKNKPFDCVEMKQRAQEAVRDKIAHLAESERMDFFARSFEALLERQTKLRAQAKDRERKADPR